MAIGSKTRRQLTTRLGLRSSGLLMTPEEFDNLTDDAFASKHLRHELINGVFIVTPPPGNAEISPNEDLGYLVRLHKEFHPQGSIIDEVLSEQTIYATPNRRRADRAIWIGLGRVPDLEKDIPAIVIEFVSAKKRDHRRDYDEKRAEYLAIGVREYWIIDRFQRILTVYKDGPAGVVTLVIKEAEAYETDLLPGFILPLARLLARADDWLPKKKRNSLKPPLEGDPR